LDDGVVSRLAYLGVEALDCKRPKFIREGQDVLGRSDVVRENLVQGLEAVERTIEYGPPSTPDEAEPVGVGHHPNPKWVIDQAAPWFRFYRVGFQPVTLGIPLPFEVDQDLCHIGCDGL
jgi:hypothetical protein